MSQVDKLRVKIFADGADFDGVRVEFDALFAKEVHGDGAGGASGGGFAG